MRLFLGCTLLATLAFGCADDDPLPPQIPCDIRDAPCRSAIFALTAQLREQAGGRLPPTRIISRSQFAEETQSALAQRMSSREERALESVFRQLHFLPAELSMSQAIADSSIEGVAAYYDSASKTVTIIDDSAADPHSGSLTLAHEYTHALQDQREGIDLVSAAVRSTDEAMAVNALIEGEATINADATMARAAGSEYTRDAVLAFMARLLAGLLRTVEKSAAPFHQGLLVLPYPVGGLPIAQAYLATGRAGVQDFYSARPSTLAGWVELATEALPAATALPVALRCDGPDAPLGYERISFDHLGATGLIALYTRLGLTGGAAFDAARAWTNDAFSVFAAAGDGAGAAYAWRIGLRDEPAAQELERLLLQENLGITVRRDTRELSLTGADLTDVLTAWSARDGCSEQKSHAAPRALLTPLRRY